jgi:hypothetical protein
VARLTNEIGHLTSEISNKKSNIRRLEIQQNNLMSSIDDSVQDYNNDSQVQIADTAPHTATQKDWRGNFTFEAEKQSGVLVYTGGDWGTTEEHLQDGASDLFTFDSTNQDAVKSGHFEHGTNTAIDNTKQFDITASGSNTNIKTLNISQNVGNGNTLSFQETGHYNYTVWGEWGQTGGLKTDINNGNGFDLASRHNNWIVGEVTKDLPTQGSATYTGNVAGNWLTFDNSGANGKIHGTMNMTVDFANTSVVAGSLNLLKQDNSTFATATMDNMQISRTNRAFSGRLIGANLQPLQSNVTPGGTSYNNQINGSFYGPNAEEVGGTWKVSGNTNNEVASGTFAGKR